MVDCAMVGGHDRRTMNETDKNDLSKHDAEFASKFAESMAEGWGRHNSAQDFRVRLKEQSRGWILRELGWFGQHSVREHWQHCNLDDVFPVGALPGVEGLYWQAWSNGSSLRAWPFLFERVRMTVTSDNGQTWHEEEFWKRIE